MAVVKQSSSSELKHDHPNFFQSKSFYTWLLAWLVLPNLILISCGGAVSSSTPDRLQVAINPSTVNVDQGGTRTFTATVTGSSNGAVSWSVREGPSGGSITSAGVYTAPAVAGTYHVIATSQADSTRTAIANVVVPDVSVAVAPVEATVRPNEIRGFVATVRGSVNTKVTWNVQEGAAGGAITSTGLYTAPANTGFYHVTATSVADASQKASAPVTVTTASGLFSLVGDLQVPRVYHTATLLPNGKVLFAGGLKKRMFHVSSGLASAETFDPTTGLFTTTSDMGSPRYAHTATLLPSGKVLVTGGLGEGRLDGEGDPIPPPALDSAELYDPATGTFMPTGKMNSVRAGHTATFLPNGKVLIVGGSDDSATLATAEIYDPATGSCTSTGSMATARTGHTSTLLSDGTVLVAGGSGASGALASAEVYNPATGSFVPTADMATARAAHTATRLPDGRVLLAGGGDGTTVTAIAELYDPSTRSFTPTGTMGTVREGHTATLLSDGTVLVAGGSSPTETLASAEIYNPSTGSFAPTGNMVTPREGHTATLLQDGRVLAAAGVNSPSGGGINFLASAETYE